MHIGLLHVRLHIPEARSLKDKRQVVRSILDRARSRYQVSAAEVGENDVLRIAELGFAAVSNSSSHARDVVDQILQGLLRHPIARVLEHEIEST